MTLFRSMWVIPPLLVVGLGATQSVSAKNSLFADEHGSAGTLTPALSQRERDQRGRVPASFCAPLPYYSRDDPSPARGDRALIVVGLPGDAEHEAKFRELARTYREWLTGRLGFPESGVRVLFGATGEPSLKAGPATREAIAYEAADIRRGLAPEGRLWVFLLGHANERGGHVFLHLPGPDLRELELAKLSRVSPVANRSSGSRQPPPAGFSRRSPSRDAL